MKDKSPTNQDIFQKEYKKYTLTPGDYINLWKYFSDRADTIKDKLWTISTWIFAILIAIIGFIVNTIANFESINAFFTSPWLFLVLSLFAVIICIYNFIIIFDYGKHIQNNWDRAKNLKDMITPLHEFLNPKKSKESDDTNDKRKKRKKTNDTNKQNLPPICTRLIIINSVIFLIFILTSVFSLVFLKL